MKLFKYKDYKQFNESLKTADDYIKLDPKGYEMINLSFSDFIDLFELETFSVTPFASKISNINGTYQKDKVYGNIRPQDVKVYIAPKFKGEPNYRSLRDANLSDNFFEILISSIKGVEALTDYEFFGAWVDYVKVIKVWDKLLEEEIETNRTMTLKFDDYNDLLELEPKRLRNIRIVLKKIDE